MHLDGTLDDRGRWKWLAMQMVLTNGAYICELWFKTPGDSFLAKCGEWMELSKSMVTNAFVQKLARVL